MQSFLNLQPKRGVRPLFLTVALIGFLMGGGTVSHGATVVNIGSGNVVTTNTVSGCVQGSGSLKEETRTLSDFHGLDVDGAFTVTVTGQKEQTVTLSADDNLLPLILTEVIDGTLRISTKKSVCTSQPMTVTISVDTLDHIASSGANSFKIDDLKSPTIKLNLSGTSNMSLSGQASELTAALEGASEIHATELKAEKAFISIGGAGAANVHASKVLHANITGVGNIRYTGHPPEVVRNITGWGDVSPLD